MKDSIKNSIFIIAILSCSALAEVNERPNTCDYHEAKANTGSAKSEFLVGECYRTGRSGKIDLGKAEYWYKKAVESQHVGAMLALGSLYLFDLKSKANYPEAVALLEMADERGVTNAPFALGMVYLNGISVERDIEKAKAYFIKAYERGHEWAMLTMYTLSSDKADKALWKNRYEENYRKLYSQEADFQDSFKNFESDKYINEYVIKALSVD